MNLFLDYKNRILKQLFFLKKKKLIKIPNEVKNITVEIPPKNLGNDMSCNAAMILAKYNKQSPLEFANFLKVNFLKNFNEFEKIEVAKPGFININFKTDFWKSYLLKIIHSNKNYGSNKSSKLKYNIEFVSANPTGPLHVGHCRGAILGDALTNLLKFNGHSVVKEYYVNDYGNQLNAFVSSVFYRILEIKEKKPFPENKDLYPGDYIIDIAKKIIEDKKINNFKDFNNIQDKLTAESLKCSMDLIKNNLNALGVKHDIFVYESNLIKKKLVSKTIKKLEKNNYVYKGELQPPKGETSSAWKKRNQLLFNSTKFGDDTDRALQKEDNSWTYFAGDLAYHAHKLDRKFDILINILGSDHAGYIKRITAAVKAISKNKKNLICKVSQLVKLFKNGQPYKMSKRKGDYITVEDLLNEVGKDSVRFMMLNRSNDVELDFDFEKVTEKSKENPVFYVQYAYARINSIFRILKMKIDKKIKLNKKDFLINKYEIEILKKISEWPKCVEISSNRLEPHRIPYYLYDLATLFHAYWNLGKENSDLRFIPNNGKINYSRLIILQAISIVLKNGMTILGVSSPKSM